MSNLGETKAFVKSIIKRRKFMVKKNISYVGTTTLADIRNIEYVLTRIKSQDKMVEYLQRKEPIILALIPAWICLEIYGRTTKEIRKAFDARFPQHKDTDTIKILVIRELHETNRTEA